jgi:hypothetical protein
MLTFPLTVQPPVASAHATLHALRVIVAPELPLHARYEPCGRQVGQSTRTMLDHTGPGDAL